MPLQAPACLVTGSRPAGCKAVGGTRGWPCDPRPCPALIVYWHSGPPVKAKREMLHSSSRCNSTPHSQKRTRLIIDPAEPAVSMGSTIMYDQRKNESCFRSKVYSSVFYMLSPVFFSAISNEAKRSERFAIEASLYSARSSKPHSK